jgi:hypothetical protein
MARITDRWINEALINNNLVPTAKAVGVDLTGWMVSPCFGLMWTLIDENRQRVDANCEWKTLREAAQAIQAMITAYRTVADARR